MDLDVKYKFQINELHCLQSQEDPMLDTLRTHVTSKHLNILPVIFDVLASIVSGNIATSEAPKFSLFGLQSIYLKRVLNYIYQENKDAYFV